MRARHEQMHYQFVPPPQTPGNQGTY
ncbi:hypothetical protein M2412_002398, partial [Stenotrophomonas rhizophila]|nr:hypothetical protein [Stenotrophomonas rhizophila]